MITFFHAADLHFGIENYGRVDSKTGIHSRLLDFKQSFESCINQAIKENIDFFLFCGDAYKTAYPTPTQQKLLMENLFKLQQAKIPVVMLIGNHDHPLSFGKASALDLFADLPLDGFFVFSKPEVFKLETKNGPIQIIGIPWPTRNNIISREEHRYKKTSEVTSYIAERVGEIIKHLADKVDINTPTILAGHLTVSGGLFSGSEKRAIFGNDPLLLLSQLALPNFDYVALGHLHKHQNLNSRGFPYVVYSGSIDRVDFGEKKEKKGYCKVTINPKVSRENATENPSTVRTFLEFVPIKTRPFIQIEVVLKTGESQTEQILNEIKKHNIFDAILKIIYHVPEGKKDKVDLNAIQLACSNAMHLVGIVPVHTPIKRESRGSIKVDMDTISLVEKYLDMKEELKDNKKQLLEKAKLLYSEVNDNKSKLEHEQ